MLNREIVLGIFTGDFAKDVFAGTFLGDRQPITLEEAPRERLCVLKSANRLLQFGL